MLHGADVELPKQSRPSMANCAGFQALMKCRNEAVNAIIDAEASGDTDESSALFGAKQISRKKSQPKVNAARLQELWQTPVIMEVPVPGVGEAPDMKVSVIRPVRPAEELCVSLNGDTLEHIVLFIRDRGIDAESLLTRRQYGGMEREKGVWRNGGAGLVRMSRGPDTAEDGDTFGVARPKRKCTSMKQALADGSEDPTEAASDLPLGDA